MRGANRMCLQTCTIEWFLHARTRAHYDCEMRGSVYVVRRSAWLMKYTRCESSNAQSHPSGNGSSAASAPAYTATRSERYLEMRAAPTHGYGAYPRCHSQQWQPVWLQGPRSTPQQRLLVRRRGPRPRQHQRSGFAARPRWRGWVLPRAAFPCSACTAVLHTRTSTHTHSFTHTTTGKPVHTLAVASTSLHVLPRVHNHV